MSDNNRLRYFALDDLREVVAAKARAVSLDQIADVLYANASNPQRAARQLAAREVTRGDWIIARGLSRPVPRLTVPLYSSSRAGGANMAVPGRVSYQARKRWKASPRSVVYVVATPRSRAQYGLERAPRQPRSAEVAHDLAVTALYLGLVSQDALRAKGWIHEDLLETTPAGIRPDAAIVERNGEMTYLDFLGAYGPVKVASMFARYQALGVRFEFW